MISDIMKRLDTCR